MNINPLNLGMNTVNSFLVLLAISVFTLRHLVKHLRRGLRLPPGPTGLPIIGNVLELKSEKHNEPTWIKYYNWSQTYGDVFTFNHVSTFSFLPTTTTLSQSNNLPPPKKMFTLRLITLAALSALFVSVHAQASSSTDVASGSSAATDSTAATASTAASGSVTATGPPTASVSGSTGSQTVSGSGGSGNGTGTATGPASSGSNAAQALDSYRAVSAAVLALVGSVVVL